MLVLVPVLEFGLVMMGECCAVLMEIGSRRWILLNWTEMVVLMSVEETVAEKML